MLRGGFHPNAEIFGKEIFLSREEAEAALKKRRRVDNEAD